MSNCYFTRARRSIFGIAPMLLGALLVIATVAAQAQVLLPRTSPVVNDAPYRTDPGDRGQIKEAYGRLPLSFEPNVGQTDPAVRFLTRGSGYTLFLTGEEAVLRINEAAESTDGLKAGAKRLSVSSSPPNRQPAVVRIRVADATSGFGMVGVDPLPGETNYFAGSDPAKWKTHITTVRLQLDCAGITTQPAKEAMKGPEPERLVARVRNCHRRGWSCEDRRRLVVKVELRGRDNREGTVYAGAR